KGELRRARHIAADGLILATSLWLLWIANSATSTICFVIGTFVIAATRLFRTLRQPKRVHIMMLALISLSLFALFFDHSGGLVESVGRNSTLTGRTAIWQQVVRMSGNPVLGSGFESFWLGARLREFWENNHGSAINEAHNGYLEVYLNLGWCGAALLAAVMAKGYRNVIAALRLNADLGGFKVANFVVAVIYNLTEAGFRMSAFTWGFFLLITMPPLEPPA